MEYYNNILYVTGKELVVSESNPGGVVPEGTFKSWISRGKIKNLNEYACFGVHAKYRLDSVPEPYRSLWIRKNNPEEKVQTDIFLDNYREDEAAADYFNSYIVEYGEGLNNKGLSPERQAEYTFNASVLNAIGKTKEECLVERRARNIPKFVNFWERAALSLELFLEKSIYHTLPSNPRRLRERYSKYAEEGYGALVHKNYTNDNTIKITEEAGEWILAQWMSQVDRVTIEQLYIRYNKKAHEINTEAGKEIWKKLKTSASIRNYLFRPETERIWHAARYGELSSKEKYSRQNRTILPKRRDSLWYSDGTKLNYFYKDKYGNVQTCNVYEVMDVYSECFLGYHISKSEDYEAQYTAYKMAMKISGHKPHEIRYDNQGGHKKLENGDLLKNLARHSIRTAPYNGKSKTIESAFGRYQAEFLHKDWFFTGQNMGSKKKESRANMEFVLANTDNLPTLEEIKELYRLRREEWNSAPHYKTGISRKEMYETSVNDETRRVDMFDIVSVFGIMTDKPAAYTAAGIELEVKGEIYPFEVLDSDGEPDRDFNRRNIGRRFYRRYCPEDLFSIALYEKDATGMRFVAYAQPYLTVHRALQDQENIDRLRIVSNRIANKEERIRDEVQRSKILEKHNLHPNQHGLNPAPLKGITSGKKQKKDIGQHLKEESNRIEERKLLEKYNRGKIKKEEKKKAEEAERTQNDYLEYLRKKKELETVSIN